MIGYIYRIVNDTTEDVYIGSTIQSLKNRFKAHRSNANQDRPGRLYEYMRDIGVDHFQIESLETIEFNHISELLKKEHQYFISLKPSLNMIAPKTNVVEKLGRIYVVEFTNDIKHFYVGSTTNPLEFRLCQHRSASNKGTTPLYTFMREHGKENFSIRCVEDNIPLPELISREEHWIHEMKPTLNKSIHLTRTEQERDRERYLRNREKRLTQVGKRRLLKRDEINAQKKNHYRRQQEILNATIVVPYETSPGFSYNTLRDEKLLNLRIMARRLSMSDYSRTKEELIQKILARQDEVFSTSGSPSTNDPPPLLE